MTESEFQIVRGVAFLVTLGVVGLLQRVARHAATPGSWRMNGGFWIVDAAVTGIVCGACACAVALWAEGERVGLLNGLDVPMGIGALASVAMLDLVSYGWHRANHRIPFLWRFHQVHHSDESFTLSTGLRFHPGELLLSLPIRLTAIVVLGAPAVGVAVFEVLFMFQNLLEHGNVNLPGSLERRLDRVLVTPALHRRHHSRRAAELDTNFGTIFILWDRLLGTFLASVSTDRVRTGLPNLSIRTFTEALLLPVRSPTRTGR